MAKGTEKVEERIFIFTVDLEILVHSRITFGICSFPFRRLVFGQNKLTALVDPEIHFAVI